MKNFCTLLYTHTVIKSSVYCNAQKIIHFYAFLVQLLVVRLLLFEFYILYKGKIEGIFWGQRTAGTIERMQRQCKSRVLCQKPVSTVLYLLVRCATGIPLIPCGRSLLKSRVKCVYPKCFSVHFKNSYPLIMLRSKFSFVYTHF